MRATSKVISSLESVKKVGAPVHNKLAPTIKKRREIQNDRFTNGFEKQESAKERKNDRKKEKIVFSVKLINIKGALAEKKS